MIEAPLPLDETARMAKLRAYDILDTDPEEGFDDLARLASSICGTPIALVSLIDEHRQWFKSRIGLAATETPRRLAFCSHAILEPTRPLIVPDSSQDERFADNPLVTGHPFVRFYAGSPLLTAEGLALGTLCVIDHRPRQIEPAHLESLQILARQVVAQLELRKRALELRQATRQTQDAYTQLLQRNEEIGRFYHTLAHELKTPLAAAREFTAIVLDGIPGPVNDAQKEFLTTTKACCDQIRKHVDDLLDLTRFETGKLSLDRSPVSLANALALTVAEHAKGAAEKGITVVRNIPPNLPSVTGDEGRITQVLTNLLSNAVKFTPEGGRITISVEMMATEGFVSISVADTGIGIDAYDVPRVFERLYQVREDDAAIKGGLGLGLSLCREIVRAHGGTITVVSTLGQGSTFTIALPVDEAGPAFSRQTAPYEVTCP